jgi:hypothetical protein
MKALPILLLLLTALTAPIAAQMDYQPPPDLDPLNRAYDKFLDAHARDGIFSYREIRLDRATLDRLRRVAWLTGCGGVAPHVGQAAADCLLDQRVQRYFAADRSCTLPGPRCRRSLAPSISSNTRWGARPSRWIRSKTPSLRLTTIRGFIWSSDGAPWAAAGSAASRSTGARLEAQLAQSAQQFATRPEKVRIDQMANTLSVSPIFSWRSQAFID